MFRLRKIIYLILISVLLFSLTSHGVVGGEEYQNCTYKGCEEPIWKGSDKYCIFHDPNPDKDKVLFEQKLKEKIEKDRIKKEKYDFSGFVFPYANFKGFKFDKYADFSNAHFYGNINFSGAIFQNGVSFTGATFHSLADFEETQFLNNAPKFDNAIFEKEVHFINTYFEGGGHFVQTTFKDYVFFTRELNSQKMTFGGEASFDKAVFEGEGSVEFRNVTFGGLADFNNVTFGEKANFHNGKFCNGADFSDVIFQSTLWFSDCIFNTEANFQSAEFKGDTYFVGTVFEKELSFKNAKFEQIFTFAPEKNNEIDLRYLRCFGNGQITADLRKTKFYHIYSIENLKFDNCIWSENLKIYEERMNDLTYAKLQTVYKDLKNSFEEHDQKDLVGKAFYREMEMKRFRAKEEGNIEDYLFLLYFKLFAGYGEKPFNIIFWSFGIIFLFALLFWIFGIEISTIPYRLEFEPYSRFTWKVDNRNKIRRLCKRRILNSICSFFSKIGLKRFFSLLWSSCSQIAIRDFAYCFLFSFSSFITLGNKYIEPKSNASRWLSVIESFIGVILIPMFIYLIIEKIFSYL